MITQLRERTFVWKNEPKATSAWLAGDAVKSAMFNIMSLGLGAHEIRIARTFRKIEDQLRDSSIKEDVQALIGQEGRHFRAHDQLNLALLETDDELRMFSERIRTRHLKLSDESSYEAALAYLLATEFSFGCMARVVLSRDDFFADAEPDIAALWIYHAIEELEHTRVSFDVVRDYMGENGVPKLLKGSLKRVLGREDSDLTKDPALQIEFTDRLRFGWIADFVDALKAPTMRAIGVKDICGYFLSEDCIFFQRSSGWYQLFDPNGWHPSYRYDEDQRLIDRWDAFLRSNGYLR